LKKVSKILGSEHSGSVSSQPSSILLW